jgi:hypothetical protein
LVGTVRFDPVAVRCSDRKNGRYPRPLGLVTLVVFVDTCAATDIVLIFGRRFVAKPAGSISKVVDGEDWFCQDCVGGSKPKLNDVVWTKVGNHKWWPAQIVLAADIPEIVQNARRFPRRRSPNKIFSQ